MRLNLSDGAICCNVLVKYAPFAVNELVKQSSILIIAVSYRDQPGNMYLCVSFSEETKIVTTVEGLHGDRKVKQSVANVSFLNRNVLNQLTVWHCRPDDCVDHIGESISIWKKVQPFL